jgi:hypothetical protein
MTATPLTDIQLPEQALTELRDVDVDVIKWIHDHAIAVGRPWWTQTLTAHGLDDTLTGETIRRADIFALADAATDDPAALTLKGWLASAYQRYATLLGMWVDQHDLGRRDSIERWLFEEGKRVRRSGSSGAP